MTSQRTPPLPLVGRDWGWGSSRGTPTRHNSPTPHPNPPPAETAQTRVLAAQYRDRNQQQTISIGERELRWLDHSSNQRRRGRVFASAIGTRRRPAHGSQQWQ